MLCRPGGSLRSSPHRHALAIQHLHGSLFSKCQTHRLQERLEELFIFIAHSQSVESMGVFLDLTSSLLRLMLGATSCSIQHLLELTRLSHSKRLLRVYVHVIGAFSVTPRPPRATMTTALRADLALRLVIPDVVQHVMQSLLFCCFRPPSTVNFDKKWRRDLIERACGCGVTQMVTGSEDRHFDLPRDQICRSSRLTKVGPPLPLPWCISAMSCIPSQAFGIHKRAEAGYLSLQSGPIIAQSGTNHATIVVALSLPMYLTVVPERHSDVSERQLSVSARG